MPRSTRNVLLTLLLAGACPLAARAQVVTSTPAGTAFTYQGRLEQNGQPATGVFDLEFRMYTGPTQLNFVVGSPVVVEDVQVTNGLFTAKVDFGPQMNGQSRWISVGVRPGNSTGAFTLLNPRQELTPAPYAVGLALPYAASNAAAGALFTLGNIGAGGAMALSSTGGDTLSITNTTGFGLNATVAGAGAAIRGGNSGTGTAVYGQTTGGGIPIYGYNLGTAGNAGFFRTESVSNAQPAIESQANGTGAGIHASSRAGHSAIFENTSAGATNGGVMSTVAGSGIPFWGKTTGSSPAARFDVDNSSSTANALEVNNAGNGLTAKFSGGDVQVWGNLYAETGTVLNRATPLAWGTIDDLAADSLRNSSGNVTVTYEANGVYRVQVVGEGQPSKWVVVASCSYSQADTNIIYVPKASAPLAVAGQPGTGVFRIKAQCIAGCDQFEPPHYTDFVVYKGF